MTIKEFFNSDWAGFKSSNPSTMGFIIAFHNASISWKYICLSIVTFSFAEGEYVVLSTTAKELTWITRQCWQIIQQQPFGHQSLTPTITVVSDILSMLSTINQECSNARTRYIEVRYHYMRWLELTSFIRTEYVPTTDQVADILTKPVNRREITQLRQLIIFDTTAGLDGKFDLTEKHGFRPRGLVCELYVWDKISISKLAVKCVKCKPFSTEMWFLRVSLHKTNIDNWLKQDSEKTDVCLIDVIDWND